MNSLFESIEKSFESIDESIVLVREKKSDELSDVESRVLERLDDPIVLERVNIERNELLHQLKIKTDRNLSHLDDKQLTRFRPSSPNTVFDNFELNINKSLVYKNPLDVHKKLTYLHLLPPPVQYVDFDLFDIKFPHSSIRCSSIISATRIFLCIWLANNDYVLQVHQINRSSLSTCKQIIKRALFKFDFEFVENRIVGAFNYRYIDIYDFNLNLIKQIDMMNNEGSFLSYKRLLSNRVELVFDCNEYFRIYSSDMVESQRVGQTTNRNAPFYIDISDEIELLNISKQFLFLTTPNRHFIQLMSRRTGQTTASFSMTGVFDIPDSSFYFGVSFYINVDSSLVYFKPDLSNSLFCLDLNSNAVVDNRLEEIQREFTSEGFQLQVLFDEYTSFSEPILLFFKRNFSTRNLKLVNIF